MERFYYDLHVHSCLSPCAENDNTPSSIAGMGAVIGLDIVALTDHNTTKNCPAFFKAAKAYNVIPIAGMELTTSEDIHVICLFPTLDDAMKFDRLVSERLMKIKNRPEIFGDQLILDDEDNVIGSVDNLLSVATDISIEALPELVYSFAGVCYPAHIDRESNGIIAILGTLPEHPGFNTVELNRLESFDSYSERFSLLDKTVVFNSDSHSLGVMNDREHYIELAADRSNPDAVAKELIERLR